MTQNDPQGLIHHLTKERKTFHIKWTRQLHTYIAQDKSEYPDPGSRYFPYFSEKTWVPH